MVFVPRFASRKTNRSSTDQLVSSSDKSANENSVMSNDNNSGHELMRSDKLQKDCTIVDSDSDNTSSPPSPMCIVQRQRQKKVEQCKRKVNVPQEIKMPITQTLRARNRWNRKRLRIALQQPSGWLTHSLIAAPAHAKFDKETKKWIDKAYRMPYQQHTYNVCKKKRQEHTVYVA